MRQFSAAFDVLRFGESTDFFWTAEVLFDGGTRYFSTTPATIDGISYDVWIREIGEIGSISDDRRGVFSVAETRLTLSNLPDELTDERFSGLIEDDFESLIVKLYLHFEDEGGNSVRELFFLGVPQSPTDWSETPITITLESLSGRYLDAPALRTLSDADHPSIRKADIGATIPIWWGSVPKVPTRIISTGSGASITADPANQGSGELREAVVGAGAVNEVVTVEFAETEVVKFDSGSAEDEVGKSTGTTVGSLTDPGGDVMPAIQGALSTRDSDDVSSGHTAVGLTASFTVNAGGSNRQAFVVIFLRGVSGTVTVTGTPTLGGNALTRVGAAVTSGSAPNSTIEVWRLGNPSAGSPSLVAAWSGLAGYSISVITMANVDASKSFVAADAGTSTSAVALKVQSGPAYMSFGLAMSNAFFAFSSGAGQTSRLSSIIEGGSGNATVSIDTKSPAASSSGSGVPADPETATMTWNVTPFGAASGAKILGAMFTVRGIITGTAVSSSGVSQNFTVPSPGMTVTSVATRLFRDFPLATTITVDIDGTQFAQVSSVTHGQTGAVVTGFGSRFLTSGSHTLTFKASGSAGVYRRGSTYQVSGVQRDARAQSWETDGLQTLVGIRLKVRKNPACSLPIGTLRVLIGANSASAPASTVLASGTVQVSSTTQAFVTIGLPAIAIPASTRFWAVGLADQDASGKGSILWGKNASGGYADGNAQRGVYSGTYDNPGTISWSGGASGEDFKFELVFDQLSFTFDGSVSGSQGTGSVGVASTMINGRLTIPATAWLGSPAAGDKFYVTINVSDGRAIVCESPAGTPIQGLGAVYWQGEPIDEAGGSVVDINDADADEAIGTDGKVQGGTFVFATNKLLKEIRIWMKKAGSPVGTSIVLQLVEANATGTAPGEVATVLAQGQIPISGITGTRAKKSFSLADRPVLARAGVPYALIASNPDGGAASHEVYVQTSTDDPYANGNHFFRSNATAGGWQRNASKDLNMEIIAVDVDKELSIDDGTGENVARLDFDCQIPDDAQILVDVTGGITDDSSGTFSGVAGALLRVPSHVQRWCLADRMLVPDEYVDLPRLADTAAKHGTTYRFDGGVIEQDSWRGVFLKQGSECRAQPEWPLDQYRLRYLEKDAPETPDIVLGPADIVMERGSGLKLNVTRTNTDEIINKLDFRWARRYAEARSETAYDRLTPVRHLPSISKFGERDGGQQGRVLFLLDYARSDAMVDDLGAFSEARRAFAKLRAQVTGKFPLLHIEEGDTVAFELDRPRTKTQVLIDRPVAYFRLADSDLVMRDSSGNGRHGAYSADVIHEQTSLVDDERDRSSEFVGEPDQGLVDLPELGVSWSIECWLRTTVDQLAILASNPQLALAIAGAAGLVLVWADADGNSVFLQTDVPLHDGEVHHVVASHNGTFTFIMVDGEIQALDDTTRTSTVILAGEWRIGAAQGAATDYEGDLDEVAIYDRGLPYIRALAHRAAGLQGYDLQ